jgi:regulatory protein
MVAELEIILTKLQKICSRQEKCTCDIIEYLNRRNIPKTLHAEIINKLLDEKYIDDNRFAQAAMNDKLRLNRWGKLKIRNYLALKQIKEEIIDNVLNSIDNDQYQQMISEELQKKALTLRAEKPENIERKIMQFAASRGYEENIVRKLINHF